MAIVVSRQDPRYESLKSGHNLRWPAEGDETSRLVLCEDPADVAESLQKIVSAGIRPTIRSGGHCYEDFAVGNPGGALIDLSLLNSVAIPKGGSAYRIEAGAQLWNVYTQLYKRYGVTIPGGTCGTVGAGGHISGGGYGLLSRLHGLTCDWLTAVDILTVDHSGKVVSRTVDAHRDSDLFRALRGAGGGSYGVITGYHFNKLPPAPNQVIEANLRFTWTEMTEERFITYLRTFGEYWETRGQDPDTWGMFAVTSISHVSAGGFGMAVQFMSPDGSISDLSVLNDYLDRFKTCGAVATTNRTTPMRGTNVQAPIPPPPAAEFCMGSHIVSQQDWLLATAREAGGGGGSRAKYKSAYLKRGFTEAEARCIYKHMHRTLGNTDLRGSILEIDSYGGAINRPSLAQTTAVYQRSSIIKMQPMAFWRETADDTVRSQWLTEFYTDLFSGPDADPKHLGTPYPNDHYDGCYCNYPDKDMLAYAYWPELYYGANGLYPFLQEVKRKYDPNNIFHHAMSIRP
ncbi:MAG TPA: FAD-binding protein [Acidobacteriaceae bacterium]